MSARSARPILVVDDEPYIVRALSFLLSREGYWVETASDGVEAVARARELKPLIVFLDISLPNMDGYAVCQAIKADAEIARAHVIMLTARGQQSDRDRGFLAGANEYLTKPFSPAALAAHVRTLVTKLEADRELEAGNAS